MRIIVDAFGGDRAPLEVLYGVSEAAKETDCEIILSGDKNKIKACAKESGLSLDGIETVHTDDIITVEDDPFSILRMHKNSSMGLGLSLLAQGEADAFVSAGSSGALVTGATFKVGRIKGVKRAAMASLMPSESGMFMLLDCGANLSCTPEVLNSFAKMGKTYLERVSGLSNPRIALANIGTERNKGTETLVEAYELMESMNYNFIGNIEVRDIPYGGADLIVCEGFTGNVILKMYEGTAGMLLSNIKRIYGKNLFTKLSALAISGGLREFKAKMDYKEFGGAPLMGISKPVIKAHGSSDARAFKNAVKQAVFYAKSGAIDEIAEEFHKKEAAEGDGTKA